MPDYLQIPGSSYSRDQTGIRRIELVFIIPGPAEADGDEPFDILDKWSPAKPPLGLEEQDRKSSKQPDGAWELRIGYAGAPTDAAFGSVVEIDYASEDAPIETLKTWQAIKKKWGGHDQDYKLLGFDPMIKDLTSGEMAPNPYFGETHYYKSFPTLRVTFGSRKFLPGIFENCSKIQIPAVPRKFDQVTKVRDNKTWLKRTVKGRFFGNAWQYSLEYVLGEWKPDIYTAGTDDGLRDAVDGSSAAAGASVGNIA